MYIYVEALLYKYMDIHINNFKRLKYHEKLCIIIFMIKFYYFILIHRSLKFVRKHIKYKNKFIINIF